MTSLLENPGRSCWTVFLYQQPKTLSSTNIGQKGPQYSQLLARPLPNSEYTAYFRPGSFKAPGGGHWKRADTGGLTVFDLNRYCDLSCERRNRLLGKTNLAVICHATHCVDSSLTFAEHYKAITIFDLSRAYGFIAVIALRRSFTSRLSIGSPTIPCRHALTSAGHPRQLASRKPSSG